MSTMHSHSSISCFFRCPREYKYKYVDGYETAEQSEDLAFGTAFHDHVEHGTLPEVTDYASARLAGLIKGYQATFPNPDLESRELQWEVDGFRGIFDGMGPGYLLEIKSTRSSISEYYWNQRVLDQQVTMYLWAARKLGFTVDRVKYQVARRAPLKPKSGEDPLAYLNRYLDHLYKYRDGIFVEQIMTRTPAQLDQFDDSLALTKKLLSMGAYPMNTNSCWQFGRFCEFLPVCNHEAKITSDLYQLRKRT